MFERSWIGFPSLTAVGGAACIVASTFAMGCDSNTVVNGTGGQGGTSQGVGGSTGGGGAEPACVGVEPGPEAYDREPGPVINMGGMGGMGGDAGMGGMGGDAGMGGAGGSLGPKDVGADAPTYFLDDVHPLSCGFEGTYGLEAFKGKVTVAALWAGW